jgi:hypothetical protein
MARLTIAEAARVAGVARSTLYRAIRDGRLSRDPDGVIDTSELLRAGFTLQNATPHATLYDDSALHDATRDMNAIPAPSLLHLERLIATLERELDAARAREAELLTLLKTLSLPPARINPWQRFREWFWRRRR